MKVNIFWWPKDETKNIQSKFPGSRVENQSLWLIQDLKNRWVKFLWALKVRLLLVSCSPPLENCWNWTSTCVSSLHLFILSSFWIWTTFKVLNFARTYFCDLDDIHEIRANKFCEIFENLHFAKFAKFAKICSSESLARWAHSEIRENNLIK